MASPEQRRRRPLARLLERFGNPLDWRAIDKTLIIQVIQAPIVFVFMLRARWLVDHPAEEPYFDRGTLAGVAWILRSSSVLSLLQIAIGLALRRGGLWERPYVYAVVVSWWLQYAALGYLHGLATTPLWAVLPLLGFYCLLLFDTRIAVTGIVTGVVVIFASTVAERAGLLPYAPMFRSWPEVNGRVAAPWLWSSMVWPVVTSGTAFVVFALILRVNQRQKAQLAEATRRIDADLGDAAAYVRSMLPPPLDGTRGIVAEWCFEPSAHLGGDAFTYAWLDEDHFAIALLDVCGHGVGSALHGISALHALRSRGLTGVDVTDPAAVATAMNKTFAMEQHHELYLTLWYGVFHRRTRRLRFVSGGHPPAILLTGPTREQARSIELGTRGPTVGVVDDAVYAAREVALEAFAELFVFSDGTFEIERPTGEAFEWSDFVRALREPAPAGLPKTRAMLRFVQAVGEREQLEDDFSLVRIEFGATDGSCPDEVKTPTRTIRLTGTDPDLGRVQDQLDELAQTHALAPAAVADVHVALDEALSNVVRHGFADRRPHEITVALTVETDELRVAIEDDGRSFNPLTAPRPDLDSPLEERRVGGLGVHLIRELMNRVHYERVSGRNRLTMVKRLRT
jgi:serine phosphatase RsbU (regulator of sigma subunit)/anti-sigma regulatory factor (Ser/Thr protein kinase)